VGVEAADESGALAVLTNQEHQEWSCTMNLKKNTAATLSLAAFVTSLQGQPSQVSAAPASSSTGQGIQDIPNPAISTGGDLLKADSPYAFSVNALFMSQYYGSDVGGIFYDGPMSFTDFILSRKDEGPTVFGRDGANRIDLSVGQKLDNADFDVDYGNEYDLIIGRDAVVGPEKFPIHYDVSVAYFALHDLGLIKDDIVQTILTVDLPKVPVVQPYVTLYRFDVINGAGSGWFLAAGIVRSREVSWISINGHPLVVSASYRFGYALSSLLGTDPGAVYHRFALSATVKASERLSVMFRWTPQFSANGQGENTFVRGTHHFFEGALSYKF
jgi:hypothetical protein